MLKYRILLPDQLKLAYEQVEKYMPDRCRTLNYFVELYFRKDTMMFELGTFAGLLWLTGISPGWRAGVHVVVWSDEARHQATRGRGILREIMEMYRLRKLIAYIPTTFEAVARFADKIGFTSEGVEKLGDYYDGQLVDFQIMALMKED